LFAVFLLTFYVKLDSSHFVYSNANKQGITKRKGKIIEASTYQKEANFLIVYNIVLLKVYSTIKNK